VARHKKSVLFLITIDVNIIPRKSERNNNNIYNKTIIITVIIRAATVISQLSLTTVCIIKTITTTIITTVEILHHIETRHRDENYHSSIDRLSTHQNSQYTSRKTTQ